ncbi:TetR/AcrR family transcriptional regulator [Microbacterium sp. BH-3-3-3]|uniref:TetR/AcrR family transcriptional regulator n=1 Tax=Microbacterium sp. BH-3-3-3 TaxID=1906742 RepID=UPI00089282DA|nr:TetR/AcrR family transcriptional regulator [Microbacterium sp. BH-3-3-3]AOX46268.1 TetR family transcriptional regulator [Microbacterium sp. BH-3-3-3]
MRRDDETPDAGDPVDPAGDGAAHAADDRLGRSGAYSKGVARRQEILDRAIGVFAERGAEGASLRSIARALGVSHAALLHYFDSREQLLVAVYDHANRQTPPAPDATALSSLTDAAAHNTSVPGLVELYTTLVAASLKDDSATARAYFTERFARLRGELAARLRSEQAEGLVRADLDPDQVAALLIAASDGLQVQWLLEPSMPLADVLGALGGLLAPAR